MPWLSKAKKDVISCDKSRGGANDLLSENIRMGQPSGLKIHYMLSMGERCELKHLSSGRKRKQIVIPSVVASERGIAQTVWFTDQVGL